MTFPMLYVNLAIETKTKAGTEHYSARGYSCDGSPNMSDEYGVAVLTLSGCKAVLCRIQNPCSVMLLYPWNHLIT